MRVALHAIEATRRVDATAGRHLAESAQGRTADVDRLPDHVHAVLRLIMKNALEARLALGEAVLGVAHVRV